MGPQGCRAARSVPIVDETRNCCVIVTRHHTPADGPCESQDLLLRCEPTRPELAQQMEGGWLIECEACDSGRPLDGNAEHHPAAIRVPNEMYGCAELVDQVDDAPSLVCKGKRPLARPGACALAAVA